MLVVRRSLRAPGGKANLRQGHVPESLRQDARARADEALLSLLSQCLNVGVPPGFGKGARTISLRPMSWMLLSSAPPSEAPRRSLGARRRRSASQGRRRHSASWRCTLRDAFGRTRRPWCPPIRIRRSVPARCNSPICAGMAATVRPARATCLWKAFQKNRITRPTTSWIENFTWTSPTSPAAMVRAKAANASSVVHVRLVKANIPFVGPPASPWMLRPLERLPPSHDPHVEDSGSGARLSWSLPTVSDSTIPWSRPLSGNT